MAVKIYRMCDECGKKYQASTEAEGVIKEDEYILVLSKYVCQACLEKPDRMRKLIDSIRSLSEPRNKLSTEKEI